MSTIDTVAAKAFAKLQQQGTTPTPLEYQKAFCKELQAAGIDHEACEKVSKTIAKLGDNYQKLLKSYNVKTEEELLQFLVSQVNRLNPSEAQAHLHALSELIAKILLVVGKLKYKEASKLAKKTGDTLESSKNIEKIVSIKSEWDSMANSELDTVFEPLEAHCRIRKNSWDTITADILKYIERQQFDTEQLSYIMQHALSPSIAKQFEEELENIKYQLSQNPSCIKTKNVQKEISRLVFRRMFLDNKEVKRRIEDIDAIVDTVSKKLSGITKGGLGGLKKIADIKTFLAKMSHDKDGFDSVKAKLAALVDSLDDEMTQLNSSIQEEASEVLKLKQKIQNLEQELEEVKEEVGVDFLTKVSNRKALEEDMRKLDELYRRFEDEYAVVFFDLDHFKQVNDQFGHLAGDTVLASFGAVLKKYSRDIDTIGRYGGEEFVCLLPKTDCDGAAVFAEKIRNAVEHTKFIYKQQRIPVTVSCGVAARSGFDSMEMTVKASDSRLYAAKENGRNAVVSCETTTNSEV